MKKMISIVLIVLAARPFGEVGDACIYYGGWLRS